MKIVDKIWQIMAHAEKFCAAKTDSIAESVKFTAAVSAVLGIIAAIEVLGLIPIKLTGLPLSGLTEAFAPPIAAAIALISVIICSVLLLLVGSAALHVFARFLGAKKGFKDTVPAMVAFMAPNLLLGWVPFVNIWTSIYTFLIIAYVLARKQNMTMAKATTAIALPIIIGTAIASAFGLIGAGGMVQTLVPIAG